MCAMKTNIKNERKTTNCVEGFSQIAGTVNVEEAIVSDILRGEHFVNG